MRQKVWLLFFVVLVSAAIFNYGAIPASERAALIALYNSTDGDHWRNNNGWKTPPLAEDGFALPGTEGSWSGVFIIIDMVWGIILEDNNLRGLLPPELEKLSHLQILRLSSNLLSGSIPPELGNLSKVEEFDISSCLLSGNIPPELGNLPRVYFLSLCDNQLSGPIPATIGNLSGSLQVLGLCNNQLSGPIPATLGKLYVYTLNLKNNQLSGAIPPELGNLSNVSIFLVSHNQLNGEIPFSLMRLDTIDSFDISYNCLYTNDLILRQWLNARNPSWADHQDQCPPLAIILNPSHLYFGATIGGPTTSPQAVIIEKNSTEPQAWTAVSDSPWLNVSPTSGTDCGMITISINFSGLPAGTFSGAISVSAPNAGNSPQTVPVTLKIYDSGTTTAPFGDFATPVNRSTVTGSIPVTGWVLDDIEVKKVEIFDRNKYIGEAVFVEGARPDVEQAYPGYPQNYKAGWGYLLLTNYLSIGYMHNYHVLYAKATDVEGNEVILGSKVICCDNANCRNPFGAIDTPIQGGITSGKSFVNSGWALTPPPHSIPVDGSTIDIWVDGISIGHPTYGLFREDIARLFPDYKNSNGAGGEFHLDTTRFKNGMHTIHWTIRDNSYNSTGIGSRYFTIMNSGSSSVQEDDSAASDLPLILTLKDLEVFPEQSGSIGKVIKGYAKDDETYDDELFPNEDGINRVSIKELEPIEIQMGENLSDIQGYMIIGGQLRSLPIGSTLDKKAGKFYWCPGPGFYGKYHLVFLIKNNGGQWSKRMIEINIDSRFDRND